MSPIRFFSFSRGPWAKCGSSFLTDVYFSTQYPINNYGGRSHLLEEAAYVRFYCMKITQWNYIDCDLINLCVRGEVNKVLSRYIKSEFISQLWRGVTNMRDISILKYHSCPKYENFLYLKWIYRSKVYP